MRSSKNAYQHGLAALMYKPRELDDAAKILAAKIVAETDGSAAALAYAEAAAEARSFLGRIREVKDQTVPRGLVAHHSDTDNVMPPERLSSAIAKLSALNRYERYAASRLNRSLKLLVPMLKSVAAQPKTS